MDNMKRERNSNLRRNDSIQMKHHNETLKGFSEFVDWCPFHRYKSMMVISWNRTLLPSVMHCCPYRFQPCWNDRTSGPSYAKFPTSRMRAVGSAWKWVSGDTNNIDSLTVQISSSFKKQRAMPRPSWEAICDVCATPRPWEMCLLLWMEFIARRTMVWKQNILLNWKNYLDK